MPPRYVVVLILVGWFWSMGKLLWQDVIPRLLPGNPPPFSIDLTDEAQQASVRWTVTGEGSERGGGSATTSIVFLAHEDLYQLHEELRFWNIRPGKDSTAIPDIEIISMNLVNADGDLRGLSVTMKLKHKGDIIRLNFQGTIEKNSLQAKITIDFFDVVGDQELPSDTKSSFSLKLNPVTLPRNANVLNPLQPVNRIPDIRLGQSWSVPSLNLLMDALTKSFPGKDSLIELPSLQARVLPEYNILNYGMDNRPTECLVIEYYNGSDLAARTWVRSIDKQVIRQEVHGDLSIFNCTALILTRD